MTSILFDLRYRARRAIAAIAVLFACGLAAPVVAQTNRDNDAGVNRDGAEDEATRPASRVPPPAASNDQASIIARCVSHLLKIQEGDAQAEWPYEGVYRVRGEIPIGYRVGGTGICGMALLQAPDYQNDPARHQAIERAVKFIIEAVNDPLMNPVYDGGYDVRGWGYTYGLTFLLQLKASDAVPVGLADAVQTTVEFFVNAIHQTEIPEVGGWNYARRRGADAVSPPSPFMTGPTLQALFTAKSMGYEVDENVIERSLKTLEGGRTRTGSICYSGVNGENSEESVPGSVGRMLVAESTLHLAGRSSTERVRSAVDAFIVHWQWLDKRRAQQGTHVPPYGIAPYYFYFAHYYAAQAVELLPQHEREEYRRRINELLMRNRLNDGTWNDRVFERSSNYGTAMAMMALLMPEAPLPAKWNR